MGQSQEKLSTVKGYSNNGCSKEVYNKSTTAASCLKSRDQVNTPRKHRVTFERGSSLNENEERKIPHNIPQRTTNVHQRQWRQSIDEFHPKFSGTYQRGLRSGIGRNDETQRRNIDSINTNGFNEELVECSVYDVPSLPVNTQKTLAQVHSKSPCGALSSFSTTRQEEDKRFSSDQSFWSSDYSTSAGGNSERSNDSGDLGNLNNIEQMYLNPRHPGKQYFAMQRRSERDVVRRESETLQQRLRERLSFFHSEHASISKNKTDINSLPEHILLHVFSFLSTKYLCLASGVCRRWRASCWDPQLWKTMKLSKYSKSNVDKVVYNILSRLAMSTQGLCLTLQYIRIVQCECLSDRGLSYIAKYCIDLQKLEILACPCVMNHGIQNILENCLRLTWLDVRGCLSISSVCDSTITNIQSHNDVCFSLTYLDISDCVSVDDLGLRTLSFTCKLLETLHMRRCLRITDVGMQHVANNCNSLRELSISDCHKVRDFSLKEISRYCSALRYLSLMRCSVTDTGIKLIAKGCCNLRYLNVRGCTGVTDVGVVYVAQNCLKLRSLDVGKCEITNTTLSALGIHCPQLKRLSIKGCRHLTDVGIRSVVAQCCLLHYLNVEDCSITLDTYDFIQEHCKNCVIEHTSLDI
ncbi:F-box/LRR-repeat protein 7-like [Xenia sp. Carnegie-2017]|uniref:F-box/LRR-repeat protein 7-like n=1 Tax=Xenia sp. Carnegie-2017 TaxID=2897299 RepID=UPI001F04EBE2|nr:F-box/LRR-repeat protein 7-like [Xenia sp. Carnegie-2017]